MAEVLLESGSVIVGDLGGELPDVAARPDVRGGANEANVRARYDPQVYLRGVALLEDVTEVGEAESEVTEIVKSVDGQIDLEDPVVVGDGNAA